MTDERISTDARDLLDAGEPAVLCTVGPGGEPRAWVMWAGLDGDEVVLTTRPHRRQAKDVERDPRVALVVYERAAPQRYVEVLGNASVHDEGADRITEQLSQQYLGTSSDPRSGPRVVLRVDVERATFHDWR